jgi:hypothetical protein
MHVNLSGVIDLGVGTSPLGPGSRRLDRTISLVRDGGSVSGSCRGLSNLGHLGTVAEAAQLLLGWVRE